MVITLGVRNLEEALKGMLRRRTLKCQDYLNRITEAAARGQRDRPTPGVSDYYITKCPWDHAHLRM